MVYPSPGSASTKSHYAKEEMNTVLFRHTETRDGSIQICLGGFCKIPSTFMVVPLICSLRFLFKLEMEVQPCSIWS